MLTRYFILENSFFLFGLRKFFLHFNDLKRYIYKLYFCSLVYKINNAFTNNITLTFKYSFVGQNSQIDIILCKLFFRIFNGSIFLKGIINYYFVFQKKINYFIRTSLVISLIKGVVSDVYCLRTFGLITITAILVNAILVSIFRNEIGLYGWIVRFLFFFIGVYAVKSRVTWQNIKYTSFFFKSV